MSYQIKYAYTCHMGKVRGNNEDNFWCCGETLPADNQGTNGVRSGTAPGWRLPALAVFDGMGGESCGEIAAFLAAEEFGKYYKKHRDILRLEPELLMSEICYSMNEAICAYGKENRINSMGTTVAMAVFTPKQMYICNLGDSRIYATDGEGLKQISADHVLGNSFLGKAPLTQYLGMPLEQQMLEPFAEELAYVEGRKYLLCSDGMTDMLSDGEIADVLTREIPLEETVELLLERALKKGGKDNVTIILCEIQKQNCGAKMKSWLKGLKKEDEHK